MTCNFCGSILDDNEVECPYCGHKTGAGNPSDSFRENDYEPSEGGFDEDLEPERPADRRSSSDAGKGTARNAGKGTGRGKVNLPKINLNSLKDRVKSVGENVGSSRTESHGNRTSAGAKNPAMLSLIGFGACALLCIICLISVSSLRNAVNSSNQAILSQMMQMQNKEQQMSDQLDALSNSVISVNTTLQESNTSKNITITKQPTSTATYLGRGGTEDNTQNVPIFTVTATGMDLKFTWQRYDEASKAWVDLVFDADSNNEEMGLHVYTDTGKGYSELAAHGVKQVAYGSYRCQISDAYGVKNTDTVILSQRDNK